MQNRISNTPLRQEMLMQCTRQKELAEALGFARSTVSKYASGQIVPSAKRKKMIGGYLRRPIRELWP